MASSMTNPSLSHNSVKPAWSNFSFFHPMKPFVLPSERLQHKFRILHILSKLFGLSPFRYKLDYIRNEVYVSTSFSANAWSIIWAVVVVLLQIIGLVSSTYRANFWDMSNPGSFSLFTICLPLKFTVNLLIVLIISIFKRHKFSKCIQTISKINNSVFITNKNTFMQILGILKDPLYAVLIFMLIPGLIFDAWFWSKYSNLPYELVLRYSTLINIVFTIQYSELVLFVARSLKRTEFPNLSQSREIYLELKTTLKLRTMYKKIYDLTQTINETYGFPIILMLIKIVADLITNSYVLIKMNESSSQSATSEIMFMMFWFLMKMAQLLGITICCHLATQEAVKYMDGVQDLLLHLSLRREVVKQLKLFSEQLVRNKIEFNALGISIDMPLFFTISATVFTYTIVLLQLEN